jgi:hypothetical protein
VTALAVLFAGLACAARVIESHSDGNALLHRLVIETPQGGAVERLIRNDAIQLERIQCSDASSGAVLFWKPVRGVTALSFLRLDSPGSLMAFSAAEVGHGDDPHLVEFWDVDEGHRSSVDLRTMEIRRLGDPPSDVLRYLSSANERDQDTAFVVIQRQPSLRADSRVRTALLALLRRAIERDAAEARAEKTPGVRLDTPWRDFYDRMIATVLALDDASALPMLARVDHQSARSGLIRFGAQAIPPIAAVLRAPAPPGYSKEFKGRLAQALATIASFPHVLRRDVESRLTALARERLSESADLDELRALVRLSDSLDDPEILGQLSQFVASPESLSARGIADSAAIRDIQTEARTVLERRTFVP